jgi:hypothetical protein
MEVCELICKREKMEGQYQDDKNECELALTRFVLEQQHTVPGYLICALGQ